MAEPSFLVLRLSSLGDIVHTLPAVAALRSGFAKAKIVWLTDERWRLLIERSNLVTTVWTIDTRSWSSIRATVRFIREGNWQAAIDYQGLWKTACLPVLGSVRRRIGFDSATIREFGVPILYTERVHARSVHVADQNGELTVQAGARQGVGNFSLRIAEEEGAHSTEMRKRNNLSSYCLLCPGGGWRAKCWPAERFGQLCARIRNELGLRCVVNYGPGESELAESVRAASADAGPILLSSSIGQLMALLRDASVVVGGDTGPVHLAVALGTPVVALYGPTDPARNGPYGGQAVALRGTDARRDHVRRKTPDQTMLEISVDAVAEAVKRRLEARR